jgi:aryl-alcohol dehydrogenase-like predicted oxidoreductase
VTALRRTLDRRGFLKLGAGASGAAMVGCGAGEQPDATPTALELGFRSLGKTGLEVSEVSFGAHGLDRPDLMRAAIDAGINTFCVSGNYLDGMEEKALGEAMSALGGWRDTVVVVTGNDIRPGTSLKRVLDDIDASLRRLRTDHIHVYLTSDVTTIEDLQVDALYEGFDRARSAGKVGHLGLSGHAGGMESVMNAAIADGRYEVFFVKYDFVSYPGQDEILRRAAKRGIGTMVFKTNAGARQYEIKGLEAGGLSFPQATVKWALTNPHVASVAVSMTNFDTIRQYSVAAASPLTTAEVAMLRRYANEMYTKYCRFCRVCEASCPFGVAVADINRYAMYFSSYGREKEAMQLYRQLPQRRSAAVCGDCSGHCDAACPFGRTVRAELLQAHHSLSFEET